MLFAVQAGCSADVNDAVKPGTVAADGPNIPAGFDRGATDGETCRPQGLFTLLLSRVLIIALMCPNTEC